uniref:Uncharacterized protein n=1 Tax=Glossina brevipalpis TaxID=37001 RepID=A0A1A9X550_9MUSC
MLLMLLSARLNKRSMSVSMRIIGKDVSTCLRALLYENIQANLMRKTSLSVADFSTYTCPHCDKTMARVSGLHIESSTTSTLSENYIDNNNKNKNNKSYKNEILYE